MKKNNKGFTLAEMLIVVAIIGVLIAILVPTFSAQLTKAEEATAQANIRSAIAEVTANGLSGAGETTKTFTIGASVSGKVGGVDVDVKAGSVTVSYSGGSATVTNSK